MCVLLVSPISIWNCFFKCFFNATLYCNRKTDLVKLCWSSMTSYCLKWRTAWSPLAGRLKCSQNRTSDGTWLHAPPHTHNTYISSHSWSVPCWNTSCPPQVNYPVLQCFSHCLFQSQVLMNLFVSHVPLDRVLSQLLHVYAYLHSLCACLSMHGFFRQRERASCNAKSERKGEQCGTDTKRLQLSIYSQVLWNISACRG